MATKQRICESIPLWVGYVCSFIVGLWEARGLSRVIHGGCVYPLQGTFAGGRILEMVPSR